MPMALSSEWGVPANKLISVFFNSVLSNWWLLGPSSHLPHCFIAGGRLGEGEVEHASSAAQRIGAHVLLAQPVQ